MGLESGQSDVELKEACPWAAAEPDGDAQPQSTTAEWASHRITWMQLGPSTREMANRTRVAQNYATWQMKLFRTKTKKKERVCRERFSCMMSGSNSEKCSHAGTLLLEC